MAKTIINNFGKEVVLNENELEVLDLIWHGDTFNDEYDTPNELRINNASDMNCGKFTKNQLKGYFSDLDKKAVIDLFDAEEYSLGCNCVGTTKKIIDQLN